MEFPVEENPRKRRRRRKHSGRKHARRHNRRSRRHGRRRGRKGFRKNAKMIKAFWRKHRAKIMKISPKKRFKYVWSHIKRGAC